MKYNRVSMYPFNHLHAQYLDPSTFAMLDGDNPKYDVTLSISEVGLRPLSGPRSCTHALPLIRFSNVNFPRGSCAWVGWEPRGEGRAFITTLLNHSTCRRFSPRVLYRVCCGSGFLSCYLLFRFFWDLCTSMATRLGRLTMNMFYNEIDQAQNAEEREWQVNSGRTG